jgi:hypothetical protein
MSQIKPGLSINQILVTNVSIPVMNVRIKIDLRLQIVGQRGRYVEHFYFAGDSTKVLLVSILSKT